MGATATAVATDFDATYGNPALLSLARARVLTLGAQAAVFDLYAGRHLSYEPMKGSLIGALVPIPFGGVLANRIAVGLGFFAPFDVVVRGRILYPETPTFLLPDRTQSVAIHAGIGFDVGNGLRLGVGFGALAALSGTVLLATDASGKLGTVVDDRLVASYAPVVGTSYDLGRSWRLGVAFRGKLVGRFDVVITAKDLGQLVVPPLHIAGIAQYDPWQVATELARIDGPWRGAVGITFKHWSEYPGPAEATVRCPVTLETGIPGRTPCAALGTPDPDFHDIVVPHLGLERVVVAAPSVRMSLRAGYYFEPTPAPEQTGPENLFDNSRSVFTGGYGVALSGPLPPIALDLFAQLHVLHERTHDRAATLPTWNAGAPSIETHGLVVAAGMTAGVTF